MKLNILFLNSFILLLLLGCSDNNKDLNLKEERYFESVVTYKFEKDKFYLIDDISLNKVKLTNIDTKKILHESEFNDTVLTLKQNDTIYSNKAIKFKNSLSIKKFEDNYVYLLKKRDYLFEDAVFNWEIKCEIINGSSAKYESGDTLEVKEIENVDFDKANEALYKAQADKKWKKFSKIGFYFDPAKASVKFATRNHTFWISKKGITENIVTNTAANIVLVKVVE